MLMISTSSCKSRVVCDFLSFVFEYGDRSEPRLRDLRCPAWRMGRAEAGTFYARKEGPSTL